MTSLLMRKERSHCVPLSIYLGRQTVVTSSRIFNACLEAIITCVRLIILDAPPLAELIVLLELIA